MGMSVTALDLPEPLVGHGVEWLAGYLCDLCEAYDVCAGGSRYMDDEPLGEAAALIRRRIDLIVSSYMAIDVLEHTIGDFEKEGKTRALATFAHVLLDTARNWDPAERWS